MGNLCQKCYDRQRKSVTPTKRKSLSYSLTEEEESILETRYKATGHGKQGKPRTEAELIVAVRHVSNFSEKLGGMDKALKLVAEGTMMSTRTLRDACVLMKKEQTVISPKKPRLTRSDPHHMLFNTDGPSLAVEVFIHKHMERVREENLYSSLMTMVGAIWVEFGEKIPKSTLHSWIEKMGMEYGKKKLTNIKLSYTNALTRRFIMEYTRYMKEGYVFVWMDESYIHTGHCKKYGWYYRKDKKAPVENRVRGSDRGKRLIIIHAMTRDGMLTEEDVDGSDNLNDECPSTAVVTGKLSAEGVEPEDYHDTLNGEKFVQWMKNRLFPAFRAKYRRSKMLLVLDNAKYHHTRGSDWVTPSKMDRVEIATYMRDCGFKNLTGEDKKGNKIVYSASTFSREVRPRNGILGGGPPIELMRKVLTDYVKSHNKNTTLVKQLMDDKGYALLYTPPYESWMQPIEMIWARVKHKVATQSKVGRTTDETIQQTKAAFEEIEANDCEEIIQHTEELMDEWLETDDAGSLKGHSILTLKRLSPHQRSFITDLNLEDTHIIGGDHGE